MLDAASDDYAVMRSIARGNTVALKILYDRHSQAVYRVSLRVLRDPAEAEQLLTDVFYEIWNTRDRYNATRSSPLTYLMCVTRSRAIDKLRRKESAGLGKSVLLDPATGIDVPVHAAPEARVSTQEQKAAVVQALSSIDCKQRCVIECAFYEGLSHSEIAAKLKKPLGTVKSSIRLGLMRLRMLLSDFEKEE